MNHIKKLPIKQSNSCNHLQRVSMRFYFIIFSLFWLFGTVGVNAMLAELNKDLFFNEIKRLYKLVKEEPSPSILLTSLAICENNIPLFKSLSYKSPQDIKILNELKRLYAKASLKSINLSTNETKKELTRYFQKKCNEWKIAGLQKSRERILKNKKYQEDTTMQSFQFDINITSKVPAIVPIIASRYFHEVLLNDYKIEQ